MCTVLQYSSVKDLISVDSCSDYSNYDRLQKCAQCNFVKSLNSVIHVCKLSTL